MTPRNLEKSVAIIAIAAITAVGQIDAQQNQSITLNPEALLRALDLIGEGRVVVDRKGCWRHDRPSRSEENQFIRDHGLQEYSKWFLGIDNRYSPRSKAHYKFPFGNFDVVHRCGLLAVEARAKQYGYADIDAAAIQLLTDMESAAPRAQKRVH
jgi:hypothetical protein